MSRLFVLVLACLLLTAALATAQPTAVRSAEPQIISATNLDQSNGTLRLTYQYRQQGTVVMEAERASVLRFTAGKGQMLADPSASDGACVAFVDHMEFHFTLRDAGTYTAWYRASFPLKGSWNHTENMDGGPTQTQTDSQGEVLDQWLWVKGPTYDLKPGDHSWNFTPYAWMGGTKLDKVLLTRDPTFKPEGVGPASSPNTLPTTGEAATEQLLPRTLVRWQKVQFDNATGVGQVQLQASTDSAVSWQPVPDNGDLSQLPPGKPLALRVKLLASADGATPYVKNLQVTYEAKAVPPIVLEDEQMRLTFAGDSGALIGLLNKRTQAQCIAPGIETPLFSFVGYRPEFHTVVEIGFGQAQLTKVTPGKGQVTLGFSLLGGAPSPPAPLPRGEGSGGLRAEVTVKLDGPLARFGMTLSNKSPYEIAQVRLLSPKGLRIGADCQDDYLFTPITTGSIVKYPAALEYPRQIYTDRPLAYPGMATMCWMDLWDEKGGGVYLACEDPRYRLTELTFSNGAEDLPKDQAVGIPPPGNPVYKYAKVPGQYVNLGFDKRLRVPRGGSATIPDVLLGVHEGDWHWGADQYRAWAEPRMAPAKRTPDWFADDIGINNFHAIHLGSFVDIPKGRPRGARQGTMQDTIFPIVAMWCQHASCESSWSTPVLHLLLGTEEEFTAGVQKQHEMGHRYISYNLPRALNPMFNAGEKRIGIVPISMYSPDQVPPAGFYSEIGERMYDGGLVSPDGVYSEANTCWGATKWRDYEHHIIYDKYLRQYHNDGMYMDGMGLDDIRTQDCKSLTHGHDTYGEWSRDFLQWLAQVKADANKTRPGTIFMGEGMGDVYHTVLDTGLFYPENAPEVYRYTCPWNTGTIMPGTSPIPGWPEGGLEYGAVYGLKIAGLDNNFEKDPKQFRDYVAFREHFQQLQSRARFMDSLGLSVVDGSGQPDPKRFSRLYTRSDAGNRYALICTYNPSGTAFATVALDQARAGDARTAWYCDMDRGWLPVALTKKGGQYTFPLPTEHLTSCLLVDKCEPLLSIAEPAPIVPGESGRIAVTVTNLEAGSLRGKLTLQLPAGWQADTAEVSLESGKSQTFELTCTVPTGTPYDVYDVRAVVTEANRLTKRCRPIGVCHAVDAELYWMKGDRVRLALRNASQKPVSGQVRLELPEGVAADPAGPDFALTAPLGPDDGKAEIVFALKGLASVKTREHMKAVLSYGKEQAVAYELVQPPLLNGGFEQDTAGDGYPDYWNYRSPEDLYLTKGVTLDREVFTEGKQSLRLDPNPRDSRNHVLTTLMRLTPGTHYRLSLKIRRSANHPGVGCRLFSLYSKDGKSSAVDIYIGYQKDGPLNEWQAFSGEFTTPDLDVPYNLLLQNANGSPATAWFDDVKLEAVP